MYFWGGLWKEINPQGTSTRLLKNSQTFLSQQLIIQKLAMCSCLSLHIHKNFSCNSFYYAHELHQSWGATVYPLHLQHLIIQTGKLMISTAFLLGIKLLLSGSHGLSSAAHGLLSAAYIANALILSRQSSDLVRPKVFSDNRVSTVVHNIILSPWSIQPAWACSHRHWKCEPNRKWVAAWACQDTSHSFSHLEID